MPTQQQYETTNQQTRRISIRVAVLDYDFVEITDIQGLVEQADISIDADSDLRRNCNITMTLDERYSTELFWRTGNPYWYDKYIQIYIGTEHNGTGEIIWENQGIYLINNPSIEFSGDNFTMTFQGTDLMSRLTGIRDGNLEGVDYTVPVDTYFISIMENVLAEYGFTRTLMDYNPPYSETPYDVRVDAGGTAYEFLSELRDINVNYEMFFDEDGVFIFQQIPSGKVITDPSTGEEGEPTPVLTDEYIKSLRIEATTDTDFEQVKNYIEVYGKTHEPYYWDVEPVISGSTITVNAPLVDTDSTVDGLGNWLIGISIGDLTLTQEKLATPITTVTLVTKSKTFSNVPLAGLNGKSNSIYYNNESYVLSLQSKEGTFDLYYYGYIQSRGVAWETNPDSPYYIGDIVTGYTTSVGTSAVIHEIINGSLGVVDMIQYSSSSGGLIDLTSILPYNTITNAPVGTVWNIQININENITDLPITDIVIRRGTIFESITDIRNTLGELTSLDFSNQSYILNVTKASSSDTVYAFDYLPIASNNFPNSTDLFEVPNFKKKVREVCVGDEYDNIFSNDLAVERAEYELYLKARLHDNITLTLVPIYWANVHQIIEYIPENEEDVVNPNNYWLIKSINTSLSVDGTQTITAMRYYPLYPST